MNPLGLIFVAIGAFVICGAGLNWDWFMTNRRARAVSALLGRTGARIFYALLGFVFVAAGALVTLGIIQSR